jgi:hypothetical protein
VFLRRRRLVACRAPAAPNIPQPMRPSRFPALFTVLLLLAVQRPLHAQTTLFSDSFTNGATTLTYANLASLTSHGTNTDVTLGDSYRVEAGNLSVLLVLFPSAVTLGGNPGDYVRLNATLRSEATPSGYFRLGLFDNGGTLWSSANGDDTGYNADFGSSTGSRAAWYATGGPAYYLTTGSPSTQAPGTSLQRQLLTTSPVMFQLQLTRTETGATFEVFRGTTVTGPTTLVYSLEHATPVTEFDEFSIFSQSARTYWIDNLSVRTGAAAIPEPSTYATLAGLLALGLVTWRRQA